MAGLRKLRGKWYVRIYLPGNSEKLICTGTGDKKEAEKKEALAREQGAEQEAQQLFYDQHLRSVMGRAHTYFSELVEHLNSIAPDVRPDYPLVPPGKAGPVLKHGPYLIRTDDDASPRSIVIRSECKLGKNHEFDVRGAADITAIRCCSTSTNSPMRPGRTWTTITTSSARPSFSKAP